MQSAYPPGARLIVIAGKEGWFNNGQIIRGSGRTQDIFLNPVFMDDRPEYQFISPVTCARCHVKLTRYWDQSKMAHTTSNPKVLDMFYGTDAFKRQGIGPGHKLDNPDDEPTAEASLIYRPVVRSLAGLKNWNAQDILITSAVW